jgi:5-methylcytosine-specific restriction protein A
MRVCSVHGCPTLYPSTEGSRCPAHRRQARAARTDNTVYSTRGHRTFRTAVLTRDPICTLCHLAVSTVADHYPRTRRELVAQGLDPNAPEHGRGLCAPCHNKWTAQSSPGGWHTH